MPFRTKIRLLIAGCLLVVGGLCYMQFRLVLNTYRLEKVAWLHEINARLGSKVQALTDSLNRRGMELLTSYVQECARTGTKTDMRQIQQTFDRELVNAKHQLNRAMTRDSLLRNVRFGFRYTEINVFHDQRIDTLLNSSSKSLDLSYELPAADESFPIGQSHQQVGFMALGADGVPVFYRLAVWTSSTVSASDWQRNIFWRMGATLAGCISLILASLLIFAAVFVAILRQKRIADITTDFANNMTHELKTPLSAAGVAVKSLRMPESRQDETWYAELLSHLEHQHERIRRIMDSVLSAAVAENIGTLQQVSMPALMSELQWLGKQVNRGISVSGLTGQHVITDPDLLTGILVNLVDNALKYTEGDIAISINYSDQYVEISVADEGPGIPKRFRRYLFDKFFRVPQPDAHNVKGLGLGLYLCRQHAHKLSGHLIYKEAPGGGSIFVLNFKNYAKDTHS